MAQFAGGPGRNSVTGSRWGAALALAYQPSEALQLAFDYYHLSTDEMPDWGVPVDITHNQPFQVDRNNFYGILARDYRTTFADIYTAKASHRRSEHASIRSLVRYGETANAYTASAPEQPALTNPDPALWTVRANAKRRDAVAAYWVSQTDATIDFHALGTEHALVFGAEVSREELLNRGRAFIECATLPCTGTSTSPVHNLFDPNPAMPWTVTDNGITSRTNFLVREAAAYTIDTIKFGPHWELLGGVRYDDYRINLRLLTISTGALSLRENHSKFWNWHVGVTYKPLPNGTLYAAYGSSSNPSGEALDATALDYGGLDPRTADLSPEHNRSFEIGTKWNVFDEHLNLTAALFRIEKSNARVALNSTTVALVGEQRADGFELGASGNITPDWSLFGGLALLDAKIVSSPLAATVGARFPNVPKASFTLMTRYEISQRLYLGATTNYNGRKFGGTVAAGTTQVPGYWRLDFFGGYRVSDSISLSFNVLNVTDEVYYDALYRSATPFVYIAPGRSAFVELEYEF
jgi:catecholate siderophore receptor